MKNLLTSQNLMYVGIGLATAFIVYNIIVSREKNKEITLKTKLEDTTSDFCGCGA
jgi:hypothetical protein